MPHQAIAQQGRTLLQRARLGAGRAALAQCTVATVKCFPGAQIECSLEAQEAHAAPRLQSRHREAVDNFDRVPEVTLSCCWACGRTDGLIRCLCCAGRRRWAGCAAGGDWAVVYEWEQQLYVLRSGRRRLWHGWCFQVHVRMGSGPGLQLRLLLSLVQPFAQVQYFSCTVES